MTQHEAIDRSIKIIKEYQTKILKEENPVITETITILLKMKSSARMIHWSKELVFEVLDKWRNEHKRNPAVTDLIESGMPKAITIKKLFDMTASAFLAIYYPREKPKKSTTRFSLLSKEDWANVFIEQYTKYKPVTAKEYNVLRDKETPTWLTIARNLKLTRWSELIKYTNVDYNLREIPPVKKETFIINSNVPLYEKLAELIEQKSSK